MGIEPFLVVSEARGPIVSNSSDVTSHLLHTEDGERESDRRLDRLSAETMTASGNPRGTTAFPFPFF